MTKYSAIINTSIGNLILSEVNGIITQCQFSDESTHYKTTSPILDKAIQQLDDYFSGRRSEFALPLNPVGTVFQERVWATLQTIPFGASWSYQELASKVGNPKAARAVGTANARNPICIIIPCHRVILATGKPGSYAGGETKKIKLLNLEQNNELT